MTSLVGESSCFAVSAPADVSVAVVAVDVPVSEAAEAVTAAAVAAFEAAASWLMDQLQGTLS